MHRLGPSLVAMVCIVFAGCVKAGPDASDGSALAAGPDPTEVDVGAGTATIEGLVTDDELVPLPGTHVQVVDAATRTEVQETLKVDDAGFFRVRGLAAGEYHVFASRIGYREAAPQRVQALAGETTTVKFILAPLAVLEPHHTSFAYTWEPKFSYSDRTGNSGQGNGCVSCGGKQSANYETKEEQNGELKTLLVEARWTANTAVCNPQMQTNVFSPDEPKGDISARRATNPYYFNNEPNVTNPTRLMIQREGSGMNAVLSPERTQLNKDTPLSVDGLWRFHTQLYPTPVVPGVLGFSCSFELRVETWVTAFHVEGASLTWSALPDQ